MVSSLTPEQRLSHIMSKINILKPYLDKFYDYYGISGSNASDMLVGAVEVLGNKNNHERLHQSAHSLREILYSLLARDGRFRSKRKYSNVKRKDIHNKLIKIFPEFYKTKKIYGELTVIAHHLPWRTDNANNHLQEFIALMEKFVDLMLDVTKFSQLKVDSLVEDIMDEGP